MEPDSSNETRKALGISGLLAASVIVSIGTFWAFQRGADDFTVFYVAWRHVLDHQAMQIYSMSPDRFLYAPGFAWLFAPLALLPRSTALALWCFAKAALVGWLVREFSRRRISADDSPVFSAGLAAWGVLLLARPVLIDFQYGQVNLLIVAACAWALSRHSDPEESDAQDFLSWFFAAVAAIGKLFPLPILIIPFFVTLFKKKSVSSRKLSMERWGVLAGAALVLFLPLLSVGASEWVSLYHQWHSALIDRGFPLESHNQSFGAFLEHYASGNPTQIIAQHRRELMLGFRLFSPTAIAALAGAWSFIFAGLILNWILNQPALVDRSQWFSRNRWIGVIIALLILPSHLVWKPYFVMGLPLALIAVQETARGSLRRWPVLLAIFIFVNFSGFDVLGQEWGARFEAASVLLWCHLALLLVSTAPRMSFASCTRSDAMMSDSNP